jgi:hypothetical protein
MSMRTVTLELLRHGPSHNQLLSPLTPYLALCGNHDPETVQVSFEHLQLTRAIEHLRYEQGPQLARFALQDAAREVSRLLESIPSLTAELSSSDPKDPNRMIHLRLVLSASELALLPLELATSHSGMPGQGQPLSLQTVTPVCLTREARRVAASTLQWPRQPRILVVAAAPLGVASVPAHEHLKKIQEALEPYFDTDEFDQHLTTLTEATLEDIRKACERTAYTHVHILAHGAAMTEPGKRSRYGLALHAQHDPSEVDIVSGERLASALRCHLRQEVGKQQTLSSPAVVTIASCDSANLGHVEAPGASVAHALHEQGIPLVIGSQFPLSVKGSIIMVELLYRRLLDGEDPRHIIHDLRQALYTAQPESHDWASVVVYAAFSGNLEREIQQARLEMARKALSKSLERAHKLPLGPVEESRYEALERKQKQARKSLDQAMSRVEALVSAGERADQLRAWGILASARKQVAVFLASMLRSWEGLVGWEGLMGPEDLSCEVAPPSTSTPVEQPELGRQLLHDAELHKNLEKARQAYYRIYHAGSPDAWPLVAYLALTMGLRRATDPRYPQYSRIKPSFKRLWAAAYARAEDSLSWGNPQQKVWAHSSMAELALLSLPWKDEKKLRARALRHVHEALTITHMGSYEEKDARLDVHSLRRQLLYYEFFGWGTQEMRSLSRELAEALTGP